ncbi:DsbA family protein [Sphingomonas sp. M1-B02]|uniref:DsbA family protein n=1 Tax=Sphingomonas sp. M1-B02 TaxID=3114300 RepID=UPI00223F412D|nr:DsbA family protein [Sphingomonas sp. S6-11]UZK65595.1 DsbA family protein [Sphingomonas sp. S6-11]
MERLLRNPFMLLGAFIASAFLGAALFALIQSRIPSLNGPSIRGYLLAHPEVLPEAMEQLQAREAAKAEKVQQSAQAALPQHLPAVRKAYAGAWAGNPQGDVTVVAFMDYACGYCRASLPGIAELIAKDPNVRVVYREFPVLGPESGVAARWALAAAEQGKYGAFHDALYAEGSPSSETIAIAAGKAGLDRARADAAAKSASVEQEVANNHKLGEALAVSGTPSWVVGDKLLYGARDYAGLAAAVTEARAGK